MSRAACGWIYFDCLDGVLNLEDTAFWRKGIDSTIVIAPALWYLYFELNMFDMTYSYYLKNI